MKQRKPKHCRYCMRFHNAGRKYPVGGLEKYNAWCTAKGAPASQSIGWCKIHGAKKIEE